MSRLWPWAKTAYNNTPDKFKQNALVEGVKGVNELAGNSIGAIFELMESPEPMPELDNPMFTGNGHDGPSPNTARYFTTQKLLRAGTTIATNIGDVTGIASGIQAASSGLIWVRLNALFNQMVPASRRAKKIEYSAWYSWTVEKKAVPSGSLEVMLTAIIRQKLYSTSVNMTKASIKGMTGGLTAYLLDSTLGTIGPKLDLMFGQDLQTLAKGLHWFGFLERVVGRGVGKGPSRRILDIIWTELSTGKVGGMSLDDILVEPRGWMVIADLLG